MGSIDEMMTFEEVIEALDDGEITRAANRIPAAARVCFAGGDLHINAIDVGRVTLGEIQFEPLSETNARLGVTGFLKLCVGFIVHHKGQLKIDGTAIEVLPFDPKRSVEGCGVQYQQQGHPEVLAMLPLLKNAGSDNLGAAEPNFNPQYHLSRFNPKALPLIVKALVLLTATIMQGGKDLELCHVKLSELVSRASDLPTALKEVRARETAAVPA